MNLLAQLGALAGAALLAFTFGFGWGWHVKDKACHTASLQAELAAAKQDKKVADEAAAVAEKAAEELRALDTQHQESIRELQDRLEKLPADRRCALSDDDVRGLQRLKR